MIDDLFRYTESKPCGVSFKNLNSDSEAHQTRSHFVRLTWRRTSVNSRCVYYDRFPVGGTITGSTATPDSNPDPPRGSTSSTLTPLLCQRSLG